MSQPGLPNLAMDRTFSAGTDLLGPDRIFALAKEASEDVRDWLACHAGLSRDILDRHRFEGLILGYLFEARRIGDRRGQYRATNPIAAFYPDTE
jgi:hypothetical protein